MYIFHSKFSHSSLFQWVKSKLFREAYQVQHESHPPMLITSLIWLLITLLSIHSVPPTLLPKLTLKYLDQHACHTWSFQPLHFPFLLTESVPPLAMPWLTSLPFWKYLFTFQLLTICTFTAFLLSHLSSVSFFFSPHY